MAQLVIKGISFEGRNSWPDDLPNLEDVIWHYSSIDNYLFREANTFLYHKTRFTPVLRDGLFEIPATVATCYMLYGCLFAIALQHHNEGVTLILQGATTLENEVKMDQTFEELKRYPQGWWRWQEHWKEYGIRKTTGITGLLESDDVLKLLRSQT